MKINEIISETIEQGKVYGWIDPHGQEFQTDGDSKRHHINVLVDLKSRGIAGTEHWNDNSYMSQALADGWIRIGAEDNNYVFAQLSQEVANRPLNYLLRIILKFKPKDVTIDIMDNNGERWLSDNFDSYRRAIAWIKTETGT